MPLVGFCSVRCVSDKSGIFHLWVSLSPKKRNIFGTTQSNEKAFCSPFLNVCRFSKNWEACRQATRPQRAASESGSAITCAIASHQQEVGGSHYCNYTWLDRTFTFIRWVNAVHCFSCCSTLSTRLYLSTSSAVEEDWICLGSMEHFPGKEILSQLGFSFQRLQKWNICVVGLFLHFCIVIERVDLVLQRASFSFETSSVRAWFSTLI